MASSVNTFLQVNRGWFALGASLAVIGRAVSNPLHLVVTVLTLLGVLIATEFLFRAYVVSKWDADARSAITLRHPFEGIWRVAAGGGSLVHNHHILFSDQRFAADFVRTDSPSWESMIFSPVSGVVRVVVDDFPDEESKSERREDKLSARLIANANVWRNPFGNYVAIECADAIYVFLCHLRFGSVLVKEGEDIVAGAAVGLCGNSGRSWGPHLHMHLQNSSAPAVGSARGIPYVFPISGAPKYDDEIQAMKSNQR